MSTAAFLDSRDFERIARAIRFIDGHFRSQPRLSAIAQVARLSEFHFNRLFRRWAGITPRQYLAFVTARAARGALIAQPSVLEAAYAVGLSGPGRLHDLLVTLEAVTPGQLKSRGAGLILRYGFAHTPFGTALLAETPRGLSHLSFIEVAGEPRAEQALIASWPAASAVRDDTHAGELATRIWSDRAGAPLRLQMQGTNFQLKVWKALLDLKGTGLLTYASVTRAADAGRSWRAVGNAVGANPIAWLIPCHTVLRGDGALGGYRYGPDRKRAMLSWQALRAGAADRAASTPRARAAT
jgi:AraC family transcriptional regulator of adaptative response/methylated-DNA-[protein]-cysteine methyltransferase